jgi:SAM-dependent methyltransferase
MSERHKTLMQRLRSGDLRVTNRGPMAYTLSSAVHYGVRVVLRKRIARDKSFVASEYQLTKRFDWRQNISLDELIFSDNQEEKWILADGELKRGTERMVRLHLLERLEARISELLPQGRGRVIEFGCGTGRNLFFLARKFPELELVGVELTPSTVEYANDIAKREGLRVKCFVGDMTGDCSHLGSADVVFSVHALEQLPTDFGLAFDNMVAASRDSVLLFEPVHELFPWSLRGVASRLRQKTANYLDGLLRYVKNKPEVELAYAAPLPYGTPLNQTIELLTKRRAS